MARNGSAAHFLPSVNLGPAGPRPPSPWKVCAGERVAPSDGALAFAGTSANGSAPQLPQPDGASNVDMVGVSPSRPARVAASHGSRNAASAAWRASVEAAGSSPRGSIDIGSLGGPAGAVSRACGGTDGRRGRSPRGGDDDYDDDYDDDDGSPDSATHRPGHGRSVSADDAGAVVHGAGWGARSRTPPPMASTGSGSPFPDPAGAPAGALSDPAPPAAPEAAAFVFDQPPPSAASSRAAYDAAGEAPFGYNPFHSAPIPPPPIFGPSSLRASSLPDRAALSLIRDNAAASAAASAGPSGFDPHPPTASALGATTAATAETALCAVPDDGTDEGLKARLDSLMSGLAARARRTAALSNAVLSAASVDSAAQTAASLAATGGAATTTTRAPSAPSPQFTATASELMGIGGPATHDGPFVHGVTTSSIPAAVAAAAAAHAAQRATPAAAALAIPPLALASLGAYTTADAPMRDGNAFRADSVSPPAAAGGPMQSLFAGSCPSPDVPIMGAANAPAAHSLAAHGPSPLPSAPLAVLFPPRTTADYSGADPTVASAMQLLSAPLPTAQYAPPPSSHRSGVPPPAGTHPPLCQPTGPSAASGAQRTRSALVPPHAGAVAPSPSRSPRGAARSPLVNHRPAPKGGGSYAATAAAAAAAAAASQSTGGLTARSAAAGLSPGRAPPPYATHGAPRGGSHARAANGGGPLASSGQPWTAAGATPYALGPDGRSVLDRGTDAALARGDAALMALVGGVSAALASAGDSRGHDGRGPEAPLKSPRSVTGWGAQAAARAHCESVLVSLVRDPLNAAAVAMARSEGWGAAVESVVNLFVLVCVCLCSMF